MTLEELAAEIRKQLAVATYDHMPKMHPDEWEGVRKRRPDYLVGYARFKYVVALVLKPQSICEIGVGGGIAARAFLTASPGATYFGIDNGEYDREAKKLVLADTCRQLPEEFPGVVIMMADSSELGALPRSFDLVHVDGCHYYANAKHDTLLALKSDSKHVLVDDAKDPAVFKGAMDALTECGRVAGWVYFDDTLTGNILFQRA